MQTMTPARAREIIRAQSQFPYWGNYQRFMTADEIAEVQTLFRQSESGNVTFASIIHRRAVSDHFDRPPNFDERDAEIARENLAAWNARQGPRVGDWVEMLDGTARRFTHDHGDGLQTTCGDGDVGSFYFSRGFMSYSGSLDPIVRKESLRAMDETKPGCVWSFHHGISGAGRGVHLTVPCRVFRQV